MGWAAPTAVMPHVAAGKVKVLGVASAQRAASLPQVPTIAESGVPGFDLDDLVRRRGAGQDAARDRGARLPRRSPRSARCPTCKERIAQGRPDAAYARRQRSSAQISHADHERFGKIIRDAGIEPN